MKMLTLDLATKTGFALGDISKGERPISGVLKLPSTGDDIGRFMLALEKWLEKFVAMHKPRLIVFEAPLIVQRRTKSGRPTIDINSARKLICLAGTVELVCSRNKIIATENNVKSIKKYFTGNGSADKAKMIAQAESMGFLPQDDNEADALAIYFHIMNKLYPTQAQKWDAKSTARLI
ncbi:MAG: hypothetical protein OCD03_13155 [Hyphomicrobiales bacterium]